MAVKPNSSDFRHGGFTEDDAEQVVRLLADEGVAPRVRNAAGDVPLEWYEHQIGRLGDGRDPDPRVHAVTAATRFVTGEAVRGLREGRRRRRLAADS